jgi:hypothetical protein
LNFCGTTNIVRKPAAGLAPAPNTGGVSEIKKIEAAFAWGLNGLPLDKHYE